jgi:hypothetical protein
MASKGEEVRQGRPQVSKFYDFFLHSYFYCVKYFFGPLYTLCGYVHIFTKSRKHQKPQPSVSDKTYCCHCLEFANVKSFPTSLSLLQSDSKC